MDEIIKSYRDECIILRNTTEENEKRIKELLTNPIVSEFFRLYSENKELKEKLATKEQRIAHLEMSECQHAFVITGTEKDWESGRIIRTHVYHCVKCGLTNYYDVTNTNDLVDGIKSQMGFIFEDTFKNGVLLSNAIISLEDAKDVYNAIINNMPNITNAELQLTFPIVLSRMKQIIGNCQEQNGKTWNPDLWKPIGYKPVDVEPIFSQKHTGFVEYQAPEDRYEVRGIMPSSKNKTLELTPTKNTEK